jgi:iron complex outermembrane receptor protein
VQGQGERINSYSLDWQGNIKVGLTPNATDEYAVTYMNQHAEKGVPPYTGDDPNGWTRWWKWPYWDVQDVHFNSNTSICDKSYVKTTAFYDTFDN